MVLNVNLVRKDVEVEFEFLFLSATVLSIILGLFDLF